MNLRGKSGKPKAETRESSSFSCSSLVLDRRRRPVSPLTPALSPLRGEGAGFSNVDLLVVLAVLFLLGAILSPILLKARASSRLETCLANLKRVTQATLQYAEENKDALPTMD